MRQQCSLWRIKCDSLISQRIYYCSQTFVDWLQSCIYGFEIQYVLISSPLASLPPGRIIDLRHDPELGVLAPLAETVISLATMRRLDRLPRLRWPPHNFFPSIDFAILYNFSTLVVMVAVLLFLRVSARPEKPVFHINFDGTSCREQKYLHTTLLGWQQSRGRKYKRLNIWRSFDLVMPFLEFCLGLKVVFVTPYPLFIRSLSLGDHSQTMGKGWRYRPGIRPSFCQNLPCHPLAV